MWSDSDSDAAMNFYEGEAEWYPTWVGTDAAMQVGTPARSCGRDSVVYFRYLRPSRCETGPERL